MPKPTIASFFTGIGGFDLGFEAAGYKVNFQCEILPYCTSVLKHHWPEVQNATDITSLSVTQIPDADVWCGGFPCQDLSVARGAKGRNGLNGKRSGLFFSLMKLAEKKKPRVILIENVQGLLSANAGRDFAELLHILTQQKYAVSWRLLNTRYFGLPQSRPRIFICAWREDPFKAGSSLFENSMPSAFADDRRGFLETSVNNLNGPIPPKMAFCLAATSGRHTGTDWSRTYIPYESEVRRLTPIECERIQGFPDHWTKTGIALVDPEKSDSLRYHALGNAVSVKVVEWIANRIKASLSTESVTKPKRFVEEAIMRWPALRGNALITRLSELRTGEDKISWPNAGVIYGDTLIAKNVVPSIAKPIHSDLKDLVERKKPDLRYFLSPNAAEGILRRVDSQGRVLFPALRRALELLSGRKPTTRKLPPVEKQQVLEFPELECALP